MNYINSRIAALIDDYYFCVPDETHAASFDRAKSQALEDLQKMSIQDFKRMREK